MQKRVIIALILTLSMFVVMGCSSDDETEDSKAEVEPTTSAVDPDTGPKGPQTIYIATGMADLNQQIPPRYLKEDLGLVSAEVKVETPGSKWEITGGGKVYKVEYRNFEDDAKAAKVRFEDFVGVYNSKKAALLEEEWDKKSTLWLDGTRYKGKKAIRKMQNLLLGQPAAPGVAAAPQQFGEVVVLKWNPPVWKTTYVSGTTPDYLYAWLESSSGLGKGRRTWVYLEKFTDDADSEWVIDELQTGAEGDFRKRNWDPLESYKIE